jgi:hypothetical protein
MPCRCNRDGGLTIALMITRLCCCCTAAALMLGRSDYPRPCSGIASDIKKRLCFCHYHQGNGTYVWPFSTDSSRACRESIKCDNMEALVVQKCGAKQVADDLEFNGYTRCLKEPDNFGCSTGGTIFVALCQMAFSVRALGRQAAARM